VMSIAFGPGADETLMQTIASATGGLSFYNDVSVSTNLLAANAFTPEDMHLDLADTYLYNQELGEERDRLLSEKGELFYGETYTHTVDVDATMTTMMATLDWFFDSKSGGLPKTSAFELTLVEPDGNKIGPADYDFEDPVSGHAGYRIVKPQAGQWQLVVEKMVEGAPYKYSVAVSGESQIEVELILLDQLDLDQTTGQEVPIRALIPIGLNALKSIATTSNGGSLSVEAVVIAPDGTETTVPMYDDGLHNQYDQGAGDGLWAGVYTLVTQAEEVDQVGENDYKPPSPAKDQGAYRVKLMVMGSGFSREALGSFAVLEGDSTISPPIPDVYIQQYGPANEDPDLDLLWTGDEYFAGTDPFESDSDSDDGIRRESDWSEVENGLNPLDPSDDMILAPETCTVLGKDAVVVLEYDVKPEYDQIRAFRRPEGGAWNFHTNLPLDTGGVYSDTLNVTNGTKYEYQINAVDGTHVSAQVLCGIASPLLNWRPPAGSLRLDDGALSTLDLEVQLSFYPYEGEDGILDFGEIHEMKLSNSADFSGAQWEPFQVTGRSWQLDPSTPGGSIATVYAMFRNQDELESQGPALGSILYQGQIYLPLISK